MEHAPFGPIESAFNWDDFSLEDVGSECIGKVCKNLQNELSRNALKDDAGINYMTICIPCYNEEIEEFYKTLLSLLENIEFIKKQARLNDDPAGQALKKTFETMVPIIVPIFDGTKAMSESMREWLSGNIPSLLDDFQNTSTNTGVEVRVGLSKWWYVCQEYCPPEKDEEKQSRMSNSSSRMSFEDTKKPFDLWNDDLRGSMSSSCPTMRMTEGGLAEKFDMDNLLQFYVVPVVKRNNHRKHNSHQWFFDAVCEAVGDHLIYAFLTDCGTTYNRTCLGRLAYELHFKRDLIGVTARQRVEGPGLFFHPCESSPFSCLRGDHSKTGMHPCWKCYATFYLSPCPLQGFEFEASLIMNSAMFNLVEALPVMPGPCQMLDWKKVREFNVVNEYFDLLFKGEPNEQDLKQARNLPSKYKTMSLKGSASASGSKNHGKEKLLGAAALEEEKRALEEGVQKRHQDHYKTDRAPIPIAHLTLTEFLRVNMRLAEDRILSFVSVFSTGYGTKWIPGATFYYQPEVQWNTLLTQRRRWLNGTFASFVFFFRSNRARSKINGGMFDQSKGSKNTRYIDALWSLQLFQMFLVLFSPAVLGATSVVGLIFSAEYTPILWGWAAHQGVQYGLVGLFFLLYGLWITRSYFAPRGKMSEWVCMALAIYGGFVMIPVYYSISYTIVTADFSIITFLVVASLFLPVVVAFGQSVTSAFLYMFYLPYFMYLLVFFLVFIPGYSFARMYDTTWGNRDTGADSVITSQIEDTMKRWTIMLSSFLYVMNIGACLGFIQLFRQGLSVRLAFMFIIFTPMIVQLLGGFIFLYIVMPLRLLFPNRTSASAAGSQTSTPNPNPKSNSLKSNSASAVNSQGSTPNLTSPASTSVFCDEDRRSGSVPRLSMYDKERDSQFSDLNF